MSTGPTQACCGAVRNVCCNVSAPRGRHSKYATAQLKRAYARKARRSNEVEPTDPSGRNALHGSEKPGKSRERKRRKRPKRQQPECKVEYRERHYRANPKQHHKLSKPSAKASIKILGFVFTRIVLPARSCCAVQPFGFFDAEARVFDGERVVSPVVIFTLSHSRAA